ncbi:MAG TPA: trypsin-like peptidase domain-containing protein [Solirubrobacteraceae bacterium]|nr:trypsin-like peptidase domain-containing protein [Solirubrobacteraceae bacterium]
MLAIDLVVGVLVAAAALAGGRLGLERALPIAGAAGGVLLGSRVPLLAGEELDSDYALNIAVVAALVLGGVGAALGDIIAGRAWRAASRSFVVDAGLAAILTGAAAAVVVWAVAPAVAEIRFVRDDVGRSEVLEQFNAVLTPVRPPRDNSAAAPDAPARAQRRPATAVGDPRLRARPEVKRAERNLVEINVNRCGGGYQGSGWIAGHGMVVTNAHVVSAADRVTVQRRGMGPALAATVVWFDGIHDLALLRVGALRSEPGLPLAMDPKPGLPGASLGFPKGKLTIRHARLGMTRDDIKLPRLELDNRAGISLTIENRLVTIIRGLSGFGASGGPMVDRQGNVVATVFAGITETDVTLGVPNRIVRSALRRADHRVEVPSCGTPPLEPTREESIAARSA